MKIKNILPAVAVLLSAASIATAQNTTTAVQPANKQNIAVKPATRASYEGVELIRQKDASGKDKDLLVRVQVDASKLDLQSTEALAVSPYLASQNDPSKRVDLKELVIAGNNRALAIKRSIALHNAPKDFKESSELVKFTKLSRKIITLQRTIPFEDWMKKSDLFVRERTFGCATCFNDQYGAPLLLGSLRAEPYLPNFKTEYITPEVEAVKRRADKIETHFNYKVGRHELLHDFGNNAKEFEFVDKFMRSFTDDDNIQMSDYVIDGYASPEGDFNSNMSLSQRRANSFADYMRTTYGIARNKMRINWHGEDWKGLRAAVEKSDYANKNAIINIIDSYSTDVQRETRIKALDGGNTYNRLLQELYPPLRRNEMTVGYTVKAFDLEEALKVYHTKPSQLSIEEFFRVANTFKEGSEDFLEVFLTAHKFYPNDAVTNLNTAAAYINIDAPETNVEALKKAEEMLQKAPKDAPETMNNKAIVLFKKGDVEQARKLFEAAAAKQSRAAVSNLHEMDKWKESL